MANQNLKVESPAEYKSCVSWGYVSSRSPHLSLSLSIPSVSVLLLTSRLEAAVSLSSYLLPEGQSMFAAESSYQPGLGQEGDLRFFFVPCL